MMKDRVVVVVVEKDSDALRVVRGHPEFQMPPPLTGAPVKHNNTPPAPHVPSR